jgi:glutamate synthase domain-containing protein 2/glutamate synthase domain-containing protein 1/glutamate synthase domain-containing protein 3
MNKHYPLPIHSEGSLHRMDLERDSCGVGLVVQKDGEKSHKVLQMGLKSVKNVVHRGVLEADLKTGDGVGILTQIPYKLFRKEMPEALKDLKSDADLAVGVFFLPREDDGAKQGVKTATEMLLDQFNLRVFGWRKVPINDKELGERARETRPSICHLLVGKPPEMSSDEFERKLYIVRRRVGIQAHKEGWRGFYVASFSSRMISYKALAVATALSKFYLDLTKEEYETAICLYHQRFATNTFPTWNLAQPFRMLCHNGEINTVRGNRNWLTSRETDFAHDVWGSDVRHLRPIIDWDDSDSASLDNALELLVLSGKSPEEAMSQLVPPAYRIDPFTSDEEKAYYQFSRCYSEPWDGPASLAFTDGQVVCACLDRNGLRPSRYKISEDGIVTIGSEVGTVEIDDATVKTKGRLAPGEMISIDTRNGSIRFNAEIKANLAKKHPYAQWLKENRVELSKLVDPNPAAPTEELDLLGNSQKQVAFGYTKEELNMVLAPMGKDGMEATHSMGDDAPLAVLSHQPKVLYHYFKQLFAQVTNPPIDPIRERLVMSLAVSLGWQRNWLKETAEHARVVYLDTPFLFEHELEKLKNVPGFPSYVVDTTWPVAEGPAGLEKALDRICQEAEKAVDGGTQILVLSDRSVDEKRVAVPALLATGAVHNHLNRTRKRMKASLVVDSGEARDVHHVACLFGFGAQAICPYLGYETVRELVERKDKAIGGEMDLLKAYKNYRSALEKGVLKIMSKMGISVLSSYIGAQIFEGVGVGSAVMERCFPGSASQIEGVGFKEIAEESIIRHRAAYENVLPENPLDLGDPGYLRFRQKGEKHAVTPGFIKNFHTFIKDGSADEYAKYVEEYKKTKPLSLHDLFELVPAKSGPIPLSEVEPIEDIMRRFTTAAMSLGALSPEAHEALAIAMNAIGGKSNSGEGGEEPRRFKREDGVPYSNSAIKQVASGRFGVSAEYLASATEIEIKMAQGAKPGEGGQLPGHKVNGIIAKLRRTQPGVQLISPPPHHDIYSIEDLAQLIHDLKQVNPRARICVKLVAETGVGTIAAGVAKANADIILISGHEGGTGASPVSSVKHAGLPWEIGLAETQQVLVLNGLRDRITLRTDGGLRNGLDVIHAAILGAEEYNFGTIALIALGCVYVRQCHLNTCPVGVATQDEKLRAKYKGKPESVIYFFKSVAHEIRELMANLGVRTMQELIGRPQFLKQRHVPDHPKANLINLSRLLKNPTEMVGAEVPLTWGGKDNNGVHDRALDETIIQDCKDALQDCKPITKAYKVKNTNRDVGTMLSGEIAFNYGDLGMPEGTVTLQLEGSAGQSLGAFLCSGVKIVLTGEANDYVGKGMCGGQIIIKPREIVKYDTSQNTILGNTVMYGSTGGHLFANGTAGERFCVRNSGGTAVVEGVGDHGCEYMTNGTVVILGATGKNFGAGMSGGVAYVLNESGNFAKLYNSEMIEFLPLSETDDAAVKALVQAHAEATGSKKAQGLLADWAAASQQFIRVQPKGAAAPAPAAAVAKA